MGFARLSFQENQWAEARQHATAALDAFTAAGRKGDQYEAAAMLARALLKEGDVGSAATLLARYPSPDSAALPVWTVVRFQIAQGFLLANTGKRAEAMRTMNGISPHGFPLLEKEVLTAREALARTHMITTARTSYN
jgi:thioredoxin-like negative regulator of GroEL